MSTESPKSPQGEEKKVRFQKITITPTVLNDSVYLKVRHSEFDQLIDTFIYTVRRRPDRIGSSLPEKNRDVVRAWCQFVFAAIVLGGINGPHAFSQILSMRLGDIWQVTSGWMKTGYHRGKFSIGIDSEPLISVLALSLCLYRGKELAKNNDFHTDGVQRAYLLPGCHPNITEEEFLQIRKVTLKHFRLWLRDLEKIARIDSHILLGELCRLASGTYHQSHSTIAMGGLQGHYVMHLAPTEQYSDWLAFREPIDLDIIFKSAKLNKPAKKPYNSSVLKNLREESIEKPAAKSDSRIIPIEISRVRSAVRDYIDHDKLSAAANRDQVLKNLSGLLLIKHREQPENFEAPIDEIHDRNADLIARFLIFLLKKPRRNSIFPPNSIAAKINDLSIVLQACPNRSLLDIQPEDLVDFIKNRCLSTNSTKRLSFSMSAFFRFCEKEVELPLTKRNWYLLRFVPISSHTQRILVQKEVDKLLQYFYARDDQKLVIIILIGYYFGLRVSEIVNLRIADVRLKGTPTLYVWNTKGDQSRFISGVDVPESVIRYLWQWREDQLELAKDKASPFVPNSQGGKISRQLINDHLTVAMNACNIHVSAGQKRSIAHLLRHACTNRWLALSVSLVAISNKLGHKSIQTSLECYIHSLHFLTSEEIRKLPIHDYVFSKTAVSILIGKSTRQVLNIFSKGDKQITCSSLANWISMTLNKTLL
jgi:site-specific recombinase XerD